MTQRFRHLLIVFGLCVPGVAPSHADPAKRYRVVTVDPEPLRLALSQFEQPGARPDCCPVSFQLFEGTTVTLYTFKVRAEPLEKWVWMGLDSLNGDESKIATLTVGFGDTAQGLFSGFGDHIRIRPLHNQGLHIIWEAGVTEERAID
jgi:hypothetical protein